MPLIHPATWMEALGKISPLLWGSARFSPYSWSASCAQSKGCGKWLRAVPRWSSWCGDPIPRYLLSMFGSYGAVFHFRSEHCVNQKILVMKFQWNWRCGRSCWICRLKWARSALLLSLLCLDWGALWCCIWKERWDVFPSVLQTPKQIKHDYPFDDPVVLFSCPHWSQFFVLSKVRANGLALEFLEEQFH